MQITWLCVIVIACVCVWQYIRVDANEERYQMCAKRLKDVTGVSPNTVTAHKNQKATQRKCLKAGEECDYNTCVHTRTHTPT